MAAIANFVIDQGSTFTAYIDLTHTNGSPWNLTGWNVRAQMRKQYTSTSKTDITATHNGKGGRITLSLTSEETADLVAPERYFYDVEIYDDADPPEVDRVVEGEITVRPEVTK